MKKITLAVFMVLITTGVYALDHTIELRSDLVYTDYIPNITYDFMAASLSPTAVAAYEKLTLKLSEESGEAKFAFNARLYVYPLRPDIEYVIDNAWVSVANGPFIFYIGKQRIKWGTGYTFNPVDSLQPAKSVLEPTEDLEGIYAARAEYSSSLFTPSLIVSFDPRDRMDDFGKNFRLALQLYKLIGTADIFINGIYQQDELQSIGAAVSWDIDWVVLNLEAAQVRYINPALHPLRAMGIAAPDTIRSKYLIGISKTLTDSAFVSFEYYRNEWGMKNSEFNDFIGSLGSSPELFAYISSSMKKDYFSLNFSYTFYDKIGISLAGLYGADDSTILLYPSISYVESTNWDISLGLIENLPYDENTEGYYTMPFYNAFEIRLNAYF